MGNDAENSSSKRSSFKGSDQAVSEEGVGSDLARIIERVQSWNARKREVMKPEHISAAYDRLNTEGRLATA